MSHELFSAVRDALREFPEGRRRDNDRHGYTREDAVPGWIVKERRGCMTVDHQGPNQKHAIGLYLEALTKAGLKVEVGPANDVGRKQILWVIERTGRSFTYET